MQSPTFSIQLAGALLLLVVGGGCTANRGVLDDHICETDADCAPDLACDGGFCVERSSTVELCGEVVCQSHETCCEEMCVATEGSTSHCGACGVACGDNQLCSAGICACQSGTADCDADPDNGCEVLLDANDPAHCGACNVACGDGQRCLSGSCVCDAGFANCDADPDNSCETDILTANAHSEDQECTGGACTCNDATLTACGQSCVDLRSDTANCGDCGVACATGQSCCSGQCLDTSADASCGGCPGEGGVACAPNQRCCDNACVGKESKNNCGACGTDCEAIPDAADVECAGGTCQIVACAAGREDCNGDPIDGCETDLLSDGANCGACGFVCNGDCEGGVCKCGDALCAEGAVCGGDGQCRCGGDGDVCRDPQEGDRCQSSSCGCGDAAACTGPLSMCGALGCQSL